MTARRVLAAMTLLVACSTPVRDAEPTPTATAATASPTASPTASRTADPSPSAIASDATELVDLAYGEAPLQRLDLYLPDGPGPHPLLFWLHGGGWVVGDKSELPFRDLPERGIAVASANHRGALDDYPAVFEDPGTALAWLVDRADTYDLDPDRIVVAGFSAGAHLAALTVLTGDVPVAGLLGFAGPYDLGDLTNIPGDAGVGASALVSLLLDCPVRDCPDRLAAVNPRAQVSGDVPPTFLQAGTADTLVAPVSTRDFAADLERAGVDVTTEVIDGGAHRVTRTAAVEDFLDRVLGPASPTGG